jgi:Gluconate 2-dehydrogenase subunit 3/TAT (twin-arginine translocation) pathway signal sequence
MVDNQRLTRTSSSSRRNFLKIGAGVIAGAAVASVLPIPLAGAKPSQDEAVESLQVELSSTRSQLTSTTAELTSSRRQATALQAQTTDLQTELDTLTGFLALSQSEQSLLAALAETIIPTDSNGAGAKEAGVIYFIDRQLASDYGKGGNMYMQGPFVQGGTGVPLTVDGITYPGGSFGPTVGGGYSYQYPLSLREFWRVGLEALESYANSAYGGNFETFSATMQAQVIQDLWNDTPTSFSELKPSDFAWELTFMVWSGFLTDPLYGGNRGMVGWSYVAFNGVNMGDFYGEGHTPQELMVATTPTRLQPASLAQYQKGSP